jgi:hypothetical protein
MGVVAVLMANQYLAGRDHGSSLSPPGQDQNLGSLTSPEDPRSHPSFEEAYSTVCEQTLAGLDRVRAAAGPDMMATISAEHLALTERIDSVHGREDLWAATDPLVLEYAEHVADDLAGILDGSETDFEYLNGDVDLLRSLCQDWYAPN